MSNFCRNCKHFKNDMTELPCSDCSNIGYKDVCNFEPKDKSMELPDGVKDITLRVNKMKRKCKTCIYYFSGIGANPCESCKKFNNYTEKAMGKNEKFEEWFKSVYEHSFGIFELNGPIFTIEQLKESFEAGEEAMLDNVLTGKKVKSELDHQTPNCYKCKYAGIVNYYAIGTIKQCMAQADKPAEDVYNNEQCQALYEVEGSK